MHNDDRVFNQLPCPDFREEAEVVEGDHLQVRQGLSRGGGVDREIGGEREHFS